MGFFNRSKGLKSSGSKELNAIKRALSTNGKKPDVKITKNIRLSFDTFTTRHNTNVLLFGGEDSYKRSAHMEPNISAFDRSFIIIDTDNSLYEKYSGQLEEKGYSVSFMDFNDLGNAGYNPVCYVYDEKTARHLAQSIMDNLEDEFSADGKGIWETAELNLLYSTIWALSSSRDDGMMNDVITLLEGGREALDELFKTADAKAASEYTKFKQDISPETQKGVVLSLVSKLQPFKEWKGGMTNEQCMADAKEYIFGKKALFIQLPEKNNVLLTASVLIDQIISMIAGEMGKIGIFRPQYPLHFMLNGIDKAGGLCDFDEILGTSESQTFAFSVFAPSVNTLQKIYGDKCDAVIAKCDTAVCLANDNDTAKWVRDEFANTDDNKNTSGNNADDALNPEEGRLLVNVRGFAPVTDEAL